ncbi:aminotransferase class I/II-fold pyridoxal phosphate-dependent enzyme [Methylocaldum sp.]|uniref:aminotransferase class I/II-fold pyridoxal phosphate-dependent enzyme n=1 Tax=Methylocaldum sp. TaxID=1969727 RepID=UPI002D50CBB0|nr:aminotransferase class I/II-fold pyridoxal phosphate-dependent enzyme [Methylocaldum sp.]HYE35148.1 aminotransferase class I/II-fold pyridoxal phosphate-dependent enzyme [Methylocaldum sp.]
MAMDRVEALLKRELAQLDQSGMRKSREAIITAVLPPRDGRGIRYLLKGEGERSFLRMNSNGYLGLAFHPEVMKAEEEGVRAYGAGPGAVRFISGTYEPHVLLEQRLAEFHGREAAMLFSSAYTAVMGILPTLISPETAVISDELNHNCIINAIRLARPREKFVYGHLDIGQAETFLRQAVESCRRVAIVTDGIFSMRGDHAPLKELMALAKSYEEKFAEGVLVIIDDSHGVGTFGATGRGTEEYAGCGPVDVLIGTLGKAFGVNGGYVVGSSLLVDYLREKAPLYIYSNPITPGEAAAAVKAVEIVGGPEGQNRLERLRSLTNRFRQGLKDLGCETFHGEHPVVPLLLRDTEATRNMVRHLWKRGILATGIVYPVVPRGDEEIRFQVSADHTGADLDEALAALRDFGRTIHP